MSIYAAEPGRYRERITLQTKVVGRSPTGAQVTTWVDFLTNAPAEVLSGPGKEPIAADAKQSGSIARVALRWVPGVVQTMRVLHDGTAYDITSIETDSTGRRELRLVCAGGLTDGR